MALTTAGWAWKPTTSGKTSDYVQRRPESETDSSLAELQGFCEEFPKVATFKLSEYAILKDRVKAASGDLYALSDLRAAHIPALRDTNRYIVELLNSKGFSRSAKYFRHEVKTLFRGQSAPGFEEDLQREIEQVFQVKEESRCSNMFLQFFYWNLIQQIEPMGDFAVDPATATSPVSDSAALDLGSGAVELILRRWQKTPAVDTQLQQVDQAISVGGLGVRVLLDLRSTVGSDGGLNDAIRQRLAQSWNNARFIVVTDSATQGDALILANEIASRDSTLYARSLCRDSLILDPSLPPVVVTRACGALGNGSGLATDFHTAISWDEAGKIQAEIRKWPNQQLTSVQAMAPVNPPFQPLPLPLPPSPAAQIAVELPVVNSAPAPEDREATAPSEGLPLPPPPPPPAPPVPVPTVVVPAEDLQPQQQQGPNTF